MSVNLDVGLGVVGDGGGDGRFSGTALSAWRQPVRESQWPDDAVAAADKVHGVVINAI